MLHIVTVATESKYYFPYLQKSCEKNGGKLEVVGFGEKWQGFNWKLKKLIEYLKQIPEKDVVCYVDGYDVLCVRPLNGLLEAYDEIQRRTRCKIVVATEQNQQMWSYAASFFFGRCEGKMLNAGTFMGYAGDLLAIVEQIYSMNPEDGADDQVMMVKKCRNRPSDFYVDTNSEIFLTVVHTLCDVDSVVQANATDPWFVHAPMYGLLDGTIRRLYPDMETSNISEKYQRDILSNKLLMYMILFFRMYFLAIVVFCVFVAGFLYIWFYKNRWIFHKI